MEPSTDNLTTKCAVALLTSLLTLNLYWYPKSISSHIWKGKVELFGGEKEWFAAQEAHFKRYVTSSGNMDTKKEKQED